MKLIIAEKPSLARNIADALSVKLKSDGFMYNDEYIVTWAFGHLFSLYDVEDYYELNKFTKWTMDNLPCIPKGFKFKIKTEKDGTVDTGTMHQFNVIKSLCHREDVDEIINAGDADREGEIIIRLCIKNAGVTDKKLSRLWLPDQTPQTIQSAIKTMKNDAEYDNLANEGFARMYIDWLYGVNLTRYATLKTGSLLRVGRVITPIVKAIYDREMEIRNFEPKTYYIIGSNVNNIELASKSKYDYLPTAECEALNDTELTVKAIKKKKETVKAGKLFSLSKLQGVLGKKYKMSMDESLEIVQGLYEKGYLTYPRTNSEYLAEAEKDKIKTIIENIAGQGYNVAFKDNKNIFDDKKIESHSALTPTYNLPCLSYLTEDERKVYETVLNRFLAVFCAEDCIVNRTEIVVAGENTEEFALKGAMMEQEGWTKYEDYNVNSAILPKLKKGDVVPHDFKPMEKKTQSPKHYNIETLNNYLKNPFKDDKNTKTDDDEDDYKAIFEGLELGTEATRTGIIKNAITSKYIDLQNGVYFLLPDGEYVINQLNTLGISMDKYKTSVVGKSLKKVYSNYNEMESTLKLVTDEIFEALNNDVNDILSPNYTGFAREPVGKCPLCGSVVTKGKYGYQCSNYMECNFKMPSTLCKSTITIQDAKELLDHHYLTYDKEFVSKAGKTFRASLALDVGGIIFKF